MGELRKLALALAEQLVVRRGRRAAGRMACAAAGALAAAGCGVAAIACGLAALWIYAVPRVGPIGAPLVVGGVLLTISLAVLVVMRYALKRRPAPSPKVAPAALLTEATRQVRRHKGSMLLAAVLAGLVAGTNEK